MIVNKIVLYNNSDAEYLKLFKTYSDVKAALFNKQKGVDYDEYEGLAINGLTYEEIGEWLNEDVVGIHTDHNSDVWIETNS